MNVTTDTIRNGVDSAKMYATLDADQGAAGAGEVRVRATNHWIDGAHNRSTIKDFYGAGAEDTHPRMSRSIIEVGEPAILLGNDTGANPG